MWIETQRHDVSRKKRCGFIISRFAPLFALYTRVMAGNLTDFVLRWFLLVQKGLRRVLGVQSLLWTVLGCLSVVTAWNVLFRTALLTRIIMAPPAVGMAHGIGTAYVIAVDPADGDRVAVSVRGVVAPNVTVVRAVVPSAAAGDGAFAALPLYTRHVMRNGRSDHMQIGNRHALGCLMSHGHVWRRIVEANASAIVLEEDLVVGPDSARLLGALFASLENVTWGILMLDPGHVNVDGEWNAVGPMAANCSSSCVWFGTRAYALRPSVAALLLAHMEPMVVQVDALITLVAAYHASTAMMHWTTVRIFPVNMTRPSTVFDGCVKCYLPTGTRPYIILILTGVVAVVFRARKRVVPVTA